MTISDVARAYHISQTRARFLARHRGVGTHIKGHWSFTPEEVEALRPGPKGHWPKGKPRKRPGVTP
jgi:hypothetical protein